MDEPRPCDQNPGREGGPLGLAQTTSTILRNGFEIDRRMGYLEPTALGREGGFPGSLGTPGVERTLTRFMGQMLILQPFLAGPQERE